jgi:hypothetical protein
VIWHWEETMPGTARLATVAAAAFLSGAVLSTEPATSAPVTLSEPGFFAVTSPIVCDLLIVISGCGGSPVPGTSANFEFNDPATGSFTVLDATNAPTGPFASVQGHAFFASGAGPFSVQRGSAGAEVSYQMRLVPAAGMPVPRFVPITVTASFDAHASGDAVAEGEVTVGNRAPDGTGLLGQAACNFSGPLCTFVTPDTLDLMVDPFGPIDIIVFAGGFAEALEPGIDSSFDARADPVVSISDALIPGTDIKFRDAFTLAISPGVTQSVGAGPGAVPEPGTWLLFAAGLGWLLGIARCRGAQRAIAAPRGSIRNSRDISSALDPAAP